MQQLFQGAGSLNEALEVISLKANRVFLITGNHFLAQKEWSFSGNMYEHYVKKGANVNDAEVTEAREKFIKSNATAILAIGGGSVIDLAKMIIWEAVQEELVKPLLAAVPTTTGSGSEATQFAVLYENNKKKSISHPALLPDIVVLEPRLLKSLTSYQAAASGMDALSQAVESWWSRAATDGSRELAGAAITLWNRFFIESLQSGSSTAREKMQQAAYKAGQAINYTRTTGPHALSYYLTAAYNIPHGQAVSLFLPLFFLYNQPDKDLNKFFGVKSNEETMLFIRDKMKKAGLAVSLAELGIRKEKIINQLLEEVNEERFSNNPVSFNYALLKKMIIQYL